jgi:hypothetical protein
MHPERYAALVHQVVRRRGPPTLAQVRHKVAAWIAQSNNERRTRMHDQDFFADLPEAEQRRCANILAALRQQIADELDYVSDEVEDPRHWPLLDEDWHQNHTALSAALTALMYVAHADEAARIDAAIAAYWAIHRPLDAV